MTPTLSHGIDFATAPVLMERPVISQRADQLDACDNLVYLSTNANAFVEHQALADAPGLTVDQVERQQLDGEVYEYRIKGIGIFGGKASRQMRGYPKIKKSKTTWDEVQDAWLTTNNNLFFPGKSGAYGGTTICVEAGPEEIYPGIYKMSATFRGIIVAKARTRVISCNGNSVTGDTIVVPVSGGWYTPRRGEVEIPAVVVQDTICEQGGPPTVQVGTLVTPPFAPNIRIVSFSGDDLTWHYPGGGWRFSCGGKQLESSNMYENTYTYTYQLLRTP